VKRLVLTCQAQPFSPLASNRPSQRQCPSASLQSPLYRSSQLSLLTLSTFFCGSSSGVWAACGFQGSKQALLLDFGLADSVPHDHRHRHAESPRQAEDQPALAQAAVPLHNAAFSLALHLSNALHPEYHAFFHTAASSALPLL